MQACERVKTILREAGLKSTSGRVRILMILSEATAPLSPKELLSLLPAGTLDKVTLYRALESFITHGLVRRVILSDGISKYESNMFLEESHCHPHFTCRCCKRTTCLFELQLVPISLEKKGYVVEQQKILFEGLCPHCATNSNHTTENKGDIK